jgi:hypothetical protein
VIGAQKSTDMAHYFVFAPGDLLNRHDGRELGGGTVPGRRSTTKRPETGRLIEPECSATASVR